MGRPLADFLECLCPGCRLFSLGKLVVQALHSIQGMAQGGNSWLGLFLRSQIYCRKRVVHLITTGVAMKLKLEIYDPNTEKDENERKAALHWELLSRNSNFGVVADRWITEPDFRWDHSQTQDYRNPKVHFPRCALDWMLSVGERAELARRQISKGIWCSTPDLNFGPVTAKMTMKLAELRKDNLGEAFRITRMTGNFNAVRVGQSWPETDCVFRSQFIRAISVDSKFQDLTQKIKENGCYLRWASARLDRNDIPQDNPKIHENLSALGQILCDISEDHHIFAIPNTRCNSASLNEYLEAVKKVCKAAGMGADKYVPYESWLGTETAWHWFLLAEQRGFDPDNSKQMYELARLYSEELREQNYSKDLRKGAKPRGFRGAKIESKALRSRRAIVVKFLRLIQRWVDAIYPTDKWVMATAQ